MDCFERTIIGTGPAGIAAARRMDKEGTCLIDVGKVTETDFPFHSLTDALNSNHPTSILGTQWEMLANIIDPELFHQKLRSMSQRFVMSGEPIRFSDSAGKSNFDSGSHALGGMSNVWGGQLIRFTDEDLKISGGWPFKVEALNKYYDDLEDHIGMSGAIDDMYNFLGSIAPKMPPVPIVPAANYLYKCYLSKRNILNNNDILIGRPRLAVSTKWTKERSKYGYGETEFFASGQQGLYTAKTTFDEIKAKKNIKVIVHHQLLGWNETQDYVFIVLRELETGAIRTFRTRHLLLGCGAVQTAQLVLKHYNEQGRELPFIDHAPILLPIFIPRMFGSKLPTKSYPIQLIATLPCNQQRDMISFYYPGGMLWSDLIFDVPLPMGPATKLIKTLIGGLLVAQIWQTAKSMPKNRMYLDKDGNVNVEYLSNSNHSVIPLLIKKLKNYGAYSLSRFASHTSLGRSFHHAGMLPMRLLPKSYETHVDGRLWNSKRVRVIDGSVLPSLPAKNHSLTIMANSARIADLVMHSSIS
jgi:choline dehydrogenase-like flavoprotein